MAEYKRELNVKISVIRQVFILVFKILWVVKECLKKQNKKKPHTVVIDAEPHQSYLMRISDENYNYKTETSIVASINRFY